MELQLAIDLLNKEEAAELARITAVVEPLAHDDPRSIPS